jgi:lysozyme
MFTIDGVDTSYVQGNYKPGSESFVFVHASRANRGFLEVGDYYHAQVDNARSAGKVVGHYFFIGNRSATECANYFVDNLYDFRDGDWLWLDSEDEPATSTVAWGPNQCLEFNEVVRKRTDVIPGMYLNRDLTKRFDWSKVVEAGSPLWLADYTGDSSDPKWWPSWLCWQYTSNPIDRNKMQIGC